VTHPLVKTPPPDPSRILLIKPSSLGDVVHALPIAHALRQHPGVKSLDWVVNPECAGVLADNPDIGRLILFPRHSWGRLPEFARVLREERYDWVVDLQGLLRSGLLARMANASWRVGMSDAREGARYLYDSVAQVSAGHAVERYSQVLGHLGVKQEGWHFPLPSGRKPLGVPEGQPFAVLHPYSRWQTKELPAEWVSQVVRSLPEVRWVVVGRGIPLGLEGVVDLTGRTDLRELLWLLREAAFVLSTDSGPMHLVAALGRPLAVVFGPTSHEKTGPWSPSARVFTAPVECRPCFSRRCTNSVERACIRSISAEEIVACARQAMAGRSLV